MRSEGIPGAVSNTAGTGVCYHIIYRCSSGDHGRCRAGPGCKGCRQPQLWRPQCSSRGSVAVAPSASAPAHEFRGDAGRMEIELTSEHDKASGRRCLGRGQRCEVVHETVAGALPRSRRGRAEQQRLHQHHGRVDRRHCPTRPRPAASRTARPPRPDQRRARHLAPDELAHVRALPQHRRRPGAQPIRGLRRAGRVRLDPLPRRAHQHPTPRPDPQGRRRRSRPLPGGQTGRHGNAVLPGSSKNCAGCSNSSATPTTRTWHSGPSTTTTSAPRTARH